MPLSDKLLPQFDDCVCLETVPGMARRAMPIKVASGKAAFIAPIFLRMRQERTDFLRDAFRLSRTFAPDRLQSAVLREDFFDRCTQRCGRTQVRGNRSENQALEFIKITQLRLRHELAQKSVSCLRPDQP